MYNGCIPIIFSLLTFISEISLEPLLNLRTTTNTEIKNSSLDWKNDFPSGVNIPSRFHSESTALPR